MSCEAGITVRDEAGVLWKAPLDKREFMAVVHAMRDACGIAHVPVECALTDDAGIAEANAAFLQCYGPTNILSFPATDTLHDNAPHKSETLHEAHVPTALLLLSVDTLAREAFLYGQDTTDHALRLLAHGMAHLAGFDHGPAMDAVQDAAHTAGATALHFCRS